MRAHHHGIEGRSPILEHQVAQQQRIGGRIGLQGGEYGGVLPGAGGISKRGSEKMVNHNNK